jgi:hypothetical protein
MAYNNYFPTGYMPQYYNPQFGNQLPQQQYQTQQNSFQNGNSSIIWVQGEAGAKSYLVAPNTTVQLWDSEAQVIYLKSADASGMPSMKIIDYTIRDNNQPQTPSPATMQTVTDYVTKDEFNAFKDQVQKMVGGRNDESAFSANRPNNSNNKQSK